MASPVINRRRSREAEDPTDMADPSVPGREEDGMRRAEEEEVRPREAKRPRLQSQNPETSTPTTGRDEDSSDTSDSGGHADGSEEVREKRKTAQEVALGVAAKKADKEYQRLQDMQRGGVYIPPHRMRALQEQIQREAGNSIADERIQRLRWDALRKSLNGLVNKVNTSNIVHIVQELFQENLVRGRGLLVRAMMKAQMASPTFTPVYAALAAIINTRMPEIGELLLHRLVLQWRRSYRRNDKLNCLSVISFLGHLVNQKVAHELLALQLIALLLEKPTDDSVEIVVEFVKQIGSTLLEVSPTGVHGVFERLRSILHEGEIDDRTQFQIEELFQVWRTEFREYPAIPEELDLVESDDQITHEVSLTGEYKERKAELDIFHYDPDWERNEHLYEQIKREILGDAVSSGSSEADESDEDASSDEDSEDSDDSTTTEDDVDPGAVGEEERRQEVQDQTEHRLINLRRTIYLTIMTTLDVEDCAHKLLKLDIAKDEEAELCNMIIECCSKERSYNSFYALVGERFCKLDPIRFGEQFDEAFAIQYATIHRYDTNRIRNIAKFFAHLLYTDALDWNCLSYVRLTEQDTTSSSRIFLKILFRYLSELMGLPKLRARLESPAHAEDVAGLFPKDSVKNARHAVNFFTAIGLGLLTESLRAWIQDTGKRIMEQRRAPMMQLSSSSSSSSDDDSSTDSSSSSFDSSDSSSYDSYDSTSSFSSSSSLTDSDSYSSDDDDSYTSASSASSDYDRRRRRQRRGSHRRSSDRSTRPRKSEERKREERHRRETVRRSRSLQRSRRGGERYDDSSSGSSSSSEGEDSDDAGAAVEERNGRRQKRSPPPGRRSVRRETRGRKSRSSSRSNSRSLSPRPKKEEKEDPQEDGRGEAEMDIASSSSSSSSVAADRTPRKDAAEEFVKQEQQKTIDPGEITEKRDTERRIRSRSRSSRRRRSHRSRSRSPDLRRRRDDRSRSRSRGGGRSRRRRRRSRSSDRRRRSRSRSRSRSRRNGRRERSYRRSGRRRSRSRSYGDDEDDRNDSAEERRSNRGRRRRSDSR